MMKVGARTRDTCPVSTLWPTESRNKSSLFFSYMFYKLTVDMALYLLIDEFLRPNEAFFPVIYLLNY